MSNFIFEILKATIISGIILAGILVILIWIKNLTKRISYIRAIIQIAAVALIFLGLIIGPFGLPRFSFMGNAPRDTLIGTNIFGVDSPEGISVPVLACYYANGRTVTCPIWQIQAYVFPFWEIGAGWGVYYSTTGLERLVIVFAFVITMSIAFGRLFCGWICPFGLYMDLLTRLRKTLKIPYWTLSERVNMGLSQSRYIIIAALLILSFVLGSEAIVGMQLVPETERGGYIFDYFSAPFCQTCPMRPLSVLVEGALGLMNPTYVFSRTTGNFFETGYYVTSLNIAILLLVSIGSFKVRRLWCRICPLGGLIAIFNRFGFFKRVSLIKLTKVEEKCTKCGICRRVCPTQVMKVYDKKGEDVTSSDCILCLRCIEMCPYEDCLKLEVVKKPICKSRNWLEMPK
jgi:ferredoxin-type protein NapH